MPASSTSNGNSLRGRTVQRDGQTDADDTSGQMLPLEQAIEARWPVVQWGATRVLVAVSGGADSVALLHALVRLRARQQPAVAGVSPPTLIDAAHFNHRWRGRASNRDEAFVAELCQRLGVRLFTDRAAAPLTGSLKSEERARDARYAFLTTTAYACGARYVVTGHNANDRVETVLHNLFRGSGLAGVTSPSFVRPLDSELLLVRPLVSSWREAIVDYLEQLGASYCQDASNRDTRYRRNYLRHSLLPLLRKEYGESVDQRIFAFSELAHEALGALRDSAAEYMRLVEALRRDAGRVGDSQAVWLPCLEQLSFPWIVVREALRELWLTRGWKLQGMSREHWQAIRRLLEAPNQRGNSEQRGSGRATEATLDLPDAIRVCRDGGWVKIYREP